MPYSAYPSGRRNDRSIFRMPGYHLILETRVLRELEYV